MPHTLTPRLRDTHAFILAGGRGSRLHGLTTGRAKPAVAFAGALRLLDFTLSNCINSGLTQVSVLSQYRSDSIEDHLDGGWCHAPGGAACDVRALRAPAAGGYHGTADAVHQHLGRLHAQGIRHVVVLAGDHVCKMDLRVLLQAHHASGADLTVASVEVPLADASAFGVIRTDAFGRVIDFEEKPARPLPVPGRDGFALASMGIYAAGLDALADLLARDAQDPASGHDFGGDILPRAVREGRLAAHDFSHSCVRRDGQAPYWRDVGTLDAYWLAHQELTGSEPQVDLFDAAWPLHTQPGPSLPTRYGLGSGGAPASIARSLICGDCRIDGARVHGTVVSPGVQVGAGSVVEDSVLLPGASLGRRVVLRRAIVDEGCVLPDGLRVGVSADEDRARFHVTAGGVTLVTAQMLQRPVPSRPTVAPARGPSLRLAIPTPPSAGHGLARAARR